MKIDIDTSKYRLPTSDEVSDAKKFILRRENYATILESRIDTILTDAAGQIAQICLKYNIPAKDFTMTSNQQMFREVSDVMDEAEEQIMELIQDFSTRVTDRESRKHLLLLWIASLGRNNMNLQQTLEGYMNRYLYDIEALVAAYKLRKERYPQLMDATIVSQIKAAQHSVYTTPAVVAAMSGTNAMQMQARYIRTHGVHRDSIPLSIIGASRSNADNVINMGLTTLRMAWMREQLMEFQDDGVVAYIQLRGSSYPCDICDSETGVHEGNISDMLNRSYPHPSCMCYRVPLYRKQETEDIQDNDYGI